MWFLDLCFHMMSVGGPNFQMFTLSLGLAGSACAPNTGSEAFTLYHNVYEPAGMIPVYTLNVHILEMLFT